MEARYLHAATGEKELHMGWGGGAAKTSRAEVAAVIYAQRAQIALHDV